MIELRIRSLGTSRVVPSMLLFTSGSALRCAVAQSSLPDVVQLCSHCLVVVFAVLGAYRDAPPESVVSIPALAVFMRIVAYRAGGCVGRHAVWGCYGSIFDYATWHRVVGFTCCRADAAMHSGCLGFREARNADLTHAEQRRVRLVACRQPPHAKQRPPSLRYMPSVGIWFASCVMDVGGFTVASSLFSTWQWPCCLESAFAQVQGGSALMRPLLPHYGSSPLAQALAKTYRN